MSIITQYLGAVESAVMVFPLVALVLTIPYVLYEYRHYGAIPILRTILVYSFILYMINAYFQVILPLPSRSEVAASAAKQMQLEPGHFLRQIRYNTDWHIHTLAQLKAFLKNGLVTQALLNLVLLFPLGIYLHYYFRCGFFLSLLLTFGCSLFFELTQLSALYGIYVHPYRSFDVDDLILNTVGGMAGWLLTPLFVFFLPSRDKIDGTAYERGKHIPFFRRFLSFAVDFSLISLVQLGLAYVIPRSSTGYILEVLISVVCTTVYFALIPQMADGCTIGKWLFRLRLRSTRGGAPSPGQYLIRSLYMSVLLAHLPHYYTLCQFMKQQTLGAAFNFWKNFQNLTRIGIALFVIEILARMFLGDREFFYEKLSRTRNESTIHAAGGETRKKKKKQKS